MVINENNAYINSFSGGMNSDTSYDMLKNNQYTYALNIRITKNQVLGGELDDYIVDREGIITPILKQFAIENKTILNIDVLACDSIDNIGVIVGKKDQELVVYKVVFDDDTVDKCILIYKSNNNAAANITSCSIVLYKELENVTKLYIATEEYPIITIRIDRDTDFNETTDVSDINYYISGRIWPIKQVYIDKLISGRLKTSQIQYTYRFYNLYGNSTKLAPLTNKIQVIDSNRNREEGNAEDTNTSIGFGIKIDISDQPVIPKMFERILIFRLSYIKPGEDASVDLIYDNKFDTNATGTVFRFSDVGADPLATLTMEEFSLLDGIIIKPKVIEQSQQYMFASNIQDDTILTGVNINSGNYLDVYNDISVTLDYETGKNSTEREYIFPEISSFVTNTDQDDLQTLSFTIDGRYFKETSSLKLKLKFRYEDGMTDIEGYRMFVDNVHSDQPIQTIDEDPADSNTDDYRDQQVLWYLISGDYEYGIGRSLNKDFKTDELILNFLNNHESSSYILQARYSKFYTNPKITLIGTYKIIDFDGSLSSPIIAHDSIYKGNSDSFLRYLKDRNINENLAEDSYNNIFTSSLLRSLRRGETYRYAIVYYDNVGRRSDVIPLGDLNVPEIVNSPYSYINDNDELVANPIGTKITLPQPIKDGNLCDNIVACQIIRRNSSDLYLKTILQVALSRPIYQKLYSSSGNLDTDSGKSPYYPLGFLHSGHSVIENSYLTNGAAVGYANSIQNTNLFLIFSSEIDFRRDDVMSRLSSGQINAKIVDRKYIAPKIAGSSKFTPSIYFVNTMLTMSPEFRADDMDGVDVISLTYEHPITKSEKISAYALFKYYVDLAINNKTNKDLYTESEYQNLKFEFSVSNIKDVSIPKWYEGFSEIQKSDGINIDGGVKQYKSYTTSIDRMSYNNWVSSSKYDLQIYDEHQLNVNENKHEYTYGDSRTPVVGFIGPGPSCFLMMINGNADSLLNPIFVNEQTQNIPVFNTAIVNLLHKIEYNYSEAEEVQQYYGFGNFFELEKQNDKYVVKHKGSESSDTMIIFDGDIYITPHEFTTLYKTYDFNDIESSLLSILVVNYVPMESKVNTYFDYGMNYANTSSANLLYEAGEITGITTQERPAHQYNMIYSDNDTSNDVFLKIIIEDTDVKNFHQRTYYSESKENGEPVDNFTKFKSVQFIDADSKYGEITNLLEHKNNLFFWQTNGFGKFSVNERSLVNDKEGNTIMLGQAGVLSRTDYISTVYGMREGDMCAKSVGDNVYWVDIFRKAIVAANNQQCINIGEVKNIQNIINSKIDDSVENRPRVDFDVQNDELLCKCLKDGYLIVINTKEVTPTSVYTRDYEMLLYISGKLYGITKNEYNISFNKLNYFTKELEQTLLYLSPLMLSIVVNPNTQITKVFDSLLMCPTKRNNYESTTYLDNTLFKFETDLVKTLFDSIEKRTDREGNTIYNIPRYNHFDDNKDRGNRTRGKWMKVDINKTDPDKYFTISHIITKFRQSFS